MNRTGVLPFVALLLAFIGLGCGPGEPSEAAAVGTWTGTFKAPGVEPFDYTLELRSDKTFTMSNTLGTSEGGKWSYQDGFVNLDYGMSEGDALRPARPRQATLLMRNDRQMDRKTSSGEGQADFTKTG